MLKKVLGAAVLLSVAATSVGAYASNFQLNRGIAFSNGMSRDDDHKNRLPLILLLAGGIGGGIYAATDNGNNNDNSESP